MARAIDMKSHRPEVMKMNRFRLFAANVIQHTAAHLAVILSESNAVITCPVPFFDCSRKSCSALYPIAAKRKVDWTDCFLNASFHFSVYDSNLSLKKKIVFLGDIENPLLKHQFSENTNLGGA